MFFLTRSALFVHTTSSEQFQNTRPFLSYILKLATSEFKPGSYIHTHIHKHTPIICFYPTTLWCQQGLTRKIDCFRADSIVSPFLLLSKALNSTVLTSRERLNMSSEHSANCFLPDTNLQSAH